MKPPCIVAVCSETDTFAQAVSANLEARGSRTRLVTPAALSDCSVSLSGEEFRVDEQPVAGILFRSFPDTNFSLGFCADDQSFSDVEVGATWLAALQLKSVVAVNRYSATAWFEGLKWAFWRRMLLEGGIAVSEFAFGDVETERASSWYPYGSGTAQTAPDKATRQVLGSAVTRSARKQASLMVCGEVIAGETSPTIEDTTRLLDQAGVRVAEIETDFDGCVLRVNPQPAITHADLIARTSNLLVSLYDAHLRNW